MTDSPVLTERIDGVLVVTINRPEARNAINTEAAEGIAAAMSELDADDDLVAGVVTGAGSTFCAGMDLKAFLAGERPSVRERGFAGIVRQPPVKPLIAAVEGHAIAGGFEVVLACDLIVAADNAVFGLPEVRRGLVAAGGGLLRLRERVPYHLAVEWALTGEFVSAAVAAEVHLVNRLTKPGAAKETAIELARLIARNGPLAVRASKAIITASRDWAADEAFTKQDEFAEPVRSSADAREGALAFKEKRAPVWRGE
ncbi:enoyl-CoA hydratase [Prauserella marina]|uniref:Enoyl-CoA hydratase n=1 Tax=Prauserella marina TaxID=530584 RepID=A0A222W041_9PSEU|nr:crotonase/enoyl-CoA hydratase family protein [Prauserella marina]ASR39311.1 enoyl-CoA hydratase [Prauserella marina]PWV76881.1 short chain enoyl-CoA hydratase [Prauserella marina]SDC99614.1 enoyl-CoA hydratase [Prauserella marina]